MVKRAVGIKTNGVEITALGSEIHAAGIIYDAAADIALYIIYGVNDAAGYGVYGVQVGLSLPLVPSSEPNTAQTSFTYAPTQ